MIFSGLLKSCTMYCCWMKTVKISLKANPKHTNDTNETKERISEAKCSINGKPLCGIHYY